MRERGLPEAMAPALRRMARVPDVAQFRRAGRPCYRPGMHASAPIAHWLGRIGYREAWDLQKGLAGPAPRTDRRPAAAPGAPAVLTLGRGADEPRPRAPRAARGARDRAIRVERGGEVTYHGPGQLVAYLIVKLADRGLLLRPFVRALEGALSDTCAAFGVTADRREGHPGCWVDPEGPLPRKIGALGIRIERGTSYHGIALNVNVDLADFGLIDPCGMPGLDSTSIAREAGRPASRRPPRAWRAAAVFAPAFAARIDAPLAGALPPDADPAAERAALERLGAAGARTMPRRGPDEPGPVRAAQGRDHRLVGRDDGRPRVRARAVRPAGGAVDDAATASTAASRPATASACAC